MINSIAIVGPVEVVIVIAIVIVIVIALREFGWRR
jgi:hypothetical protein